jgi:hypothetical protein
MPPARAVPDRPCAATATGLVAESAVGVRSRPGDLVAGRRECVPATPERRQTLAVRIAGLLVARVEIERIGLEGKVVVDATNVFAGRDERLRELEVDLGTLVSSVTCEEVCS